MAHTSPLQSDACSGLIICHHDWVYSLKAGGLASAHSAEVLVHCGGEGVEENRSSAGSGSREHLL